MFVLKNIYKPVALASEKFDFVIGNPPWIAYHSTHTAYQEFLKPQVISYYKLLGGRGELITDLEVGTFYCVPLTSIFEVEGRLGSSCRRASSKESNMMGLGEVPTSFIMIGRRIFRSPQSGTANESIHYSAYHLVWYLVRNNLVEGPLIP